VAVLVFGLVFALGDFLPSVRYGVVHKRFFHCVRIIKICQSLFQLLFCLVETMFHLIN
jgi:hypothetical protein